MNHPNDDKTVRLFNQGNREAFTTIYNTYSNSVFSYAKHFLRSREEARDIVSETFLKLLRADAHFESMEKIMAFLHITAKNACIDYFRHKEMQVHTRDKVTEAFIKFHEPAGGPDPVVEELQKRIGSEIDKLPRKSREILKLSYLEEIRNSDIAEYLKISEKTVRNRKTMALKRIRMNLFK